MSGLLFRLYAVKSETVRRLVRGTVCRLERGEMHSITLRRIFSEYHDVRIGLYSYGGCFCREALPPGSTVGRYCSCSSFRAFGRNHPLTCLSTHPFFYNARLGVVTNDNIPYESLSIGNDVWIGYGAIILPSVRRIGNGAVIGAGSVVSKNVPAYAVVAGNPATIVKYRFSARTRKLVEQSRWWEQTIDELRCHLALFRQEINEFNVHRGLL